MAEKLAVVLVRTKYPENVGMAARACLNMGVDELVLADPQHFDLDKALPLATAHAKDILTSARVEPDLASALAPYQAAYGTTARTGGWRKGVMYPGTCASVVRERRAAGDSVALVFGPEDKGLTNEETSLCTGLVTIPTAREGTSLNLAQAVLLLAYECLTARLGIGSGSGSGSGTRDAAPPVSEHQQTAGRACTLAEMDTLFAAMRQALMDMDYLRGPNPDYWMLPLKRFFSRLRITRNEFNLLMGISRQASWLGGLAGVAGKGGEGSGGPNAGGRAFGKPDSDGPEAGGQDSGGRDSGEET